MTLIGLPWVRSYAKDLASSETKSVSVSVKLDTSTETLRVPQTQLGFANCLL